MMCVGDEARFRREQWIAEAERANNVSRAREQEGEDEPDTFLQEVAEAEKRNPSPGVAIDAAMGQLASFMEAGATPKEAWLKLVESYEKRGPEGK